MRKKIEEGFTLVELSIAVVIMSMITAAVMPAFTLARYTSKEKEVKDNIHTIQMALARYANDRNGLYPKMIWGGDKRGRLSQKDYGCLTMWEHEPFNGENEDTARPPLDPLIAFNYLSHYPYNPFPIQARDLKQLFDGQAVLKANPVMVTQDSVTMGQ